MKILLLTKYDQFGASSRYRSYNYTPFFDKNNISYSFSPLLTDGYVQNLYKGNKFRTRLIMLKCVLRRLLLLISIHSKSYDLLIIEKELIPNLPAVLEKFLLKNKKYSLDFDDYVGTSYKQNRIKKYILGNKIDSLCKNAAFVTVGNRWYFDEIKSDNLIYLPTVVDVEDYPVKNKIKNDVPIIVWIGSPSTIHYLKDLTGVFQNISKLIDFKLRVIGSTIDIGGVNIENVVWSSKNEFDNIHSADIGIMPLKNTLWEKGKCGFKLIQYMACELPVIGTDSPANSEIVEQEENGYIVKNNLEWKDKLMDLLSDASKRESFGSIGRKIVEEKYSYQVWGDRYCEIIQSTL